MSLVIGLMLMVALFASLFRLGLGIDARRGNPVLRRLEAEINPERLDLDRLRRDMNAACRLDELSEDARPDDAAEQRETQLSRELTSGAIESEAYQRLMSDLAHRSRAGGAR